MATLGTPGNDWSETHLLELLRLLKRRGYAFVTPTPATHARVVARPDRRVARTVEDVLGWSLPFGAGILPPDVERCLKQAGLLRPHGEGQACAVRVSSLGDALYLHSAFPTVERDAVFFGPDTYRFASLIAAELTRAPAATGCRIVDIGTGAGVGAIMAASLCPGAAVIMTDINRHALRFARINAAAAGMEIVPVETTGLDSVGGGIDIAMINPPYIADDGARAYRDGGAMHGGQLSVDLARNAFDRLNPGGRVILYTGSAIVGGGDALREALARFVAAGGGDMAYTELDPDVFGEELTKPQYDDVDRIALIAAIIRRR